MRSGPRLASSRDSPSDLEVSVLCVENMNIRVADDVNNPSTRPVWNKV